MSDEQGETVDPSTAIDDDRAAGAEVAEGASGDESHADETAAGENNADASASADVDADGSTVDETASDETDGDDSQGDDTDGDDTDGDGTGGDETDGDETGGDGVASDETGDEDDDDATVESADEDDAAERAGLPAVEKVVSLDELEAYVIESDPERVATDLAALREEAREGGEAVDEVEEERDHLESRLKRLQAEFQNYKRRQERQREEERARATESLVERLLEVRDNLGRALEQDDDADIREGVEATFRQLDEVLRGEDVEPVEPDPGEPADPERHEVLLRVESDEPEGTVADVHRPGYEMAGKVLRPAQVTVSEGDGDDGEGPEDGADDGTADESADDGTADQSNDEGETGGEQTTEEETGDGGPGEDEDSAGGRA